MVGIQVIQPGQERKRFHRKPNFPIAGTMKPFGLYPIMLHPVLPGETLKSATTKWSVISQPLVHPLAGAWLETWMFYVKLTDIDPTLAGMFITDGMSDDDWDAAAANDFYFHGVDQIAWGYWTVNHVYNTYFINEGESPVVMLEDGGSRYVHQGKLNIQSWYQNLMFEPAEVALDTSGPRDASEQMRAWEMIQQMQMTELTYGAYLEQYGVTPKGPLQERAPEILRYNRSWTKPTNHIDSLTGTPSSAWIWNDEMKVEKDKRFDEPGFIVMMAMIRPKMFQAMTRWPIVSNLWGFSDFFPAYTLTDPAAGIKNISTLDVVFDPTWNASEGADELIYDHRDILSHGEQFVNDWTNLPYALPMATAMSGLAAGLPQDMRGEYCKVADVDALFAVQTAESDKRCYYEGITQLMIAGHVTDTTR